MPVEWERIRGGLPDDFRALDRAPAQFGFRGSGGGANGPRAAALAASWAVSFLPGLTGSIRASWKGKTAREPKLRLKRRVRVIDDVHGEIQGRFEPLAHCIGGFQLADLSARDAGHGYSLQKRYDYTTPDFLRVRPLAVGRPHRPQTFDRPPR